MAIPPEDHHDEPDLVMPAEDNLPVDTGPKSVTKQAKNYETKNTHAKPIGDEELEQFQGILIPILPDTASAVNDYLGVNKLDVDVSQESVSWYETMLEGFRSHPAKGIFEDALADPNADWRDALNYSGSNINVGRPKFSNRGRGDARMSSERLTLSVRSTLGFGAPAQSPLLGSGFYATVKPLEESDIIRLWRVVLAETVKLGRQTHGLIFSNNSVFTARAVCDAWSANLVEHTVSDLPRENLYDHITINDLPTIAHSVATALYPNGFPFSRAVFTENTKLPKEKISQLIDVRRSLWMNHKAFTEEQLAHMVKRIGTPMTLKDIKAYRDKFTFNQNTVVDLGSGIKLHLYTPSLREYFESGEKWINEIMSTVHNALGEDADQNVRLKYISDLAKSTRLRQYAHYVKAVEEAEELHSTRENVDKVLSSLSASDEVSRKFYKAVSDYINNTQISIIATTSVNEYEDELSGEKWPRLIPLDAISVFFQLVEQKLLGITSRSMEDTLD